MKKIYNEKIEDLYKKFGTSINGLSSKEAEKRLLENGENKLTERNKQSNIMMFLKQFNDFMIILLFCAAIFSAIISYIKHESFIDSIIIIVIVFVNAILSFIQEKKADVAIQELNKMFITNNYVIRDGVKTAVDAKEIVVGDIIELEAGDYVSADARIISADNLKVNESTLTGESKSIKKEAIDIDGEKELYERNNMVFAGCNVTLGHAFVLVVATAMDTELGKIATSLTDKKAEATPLQKKVDQISKLLTIIILFIILIMMGIGLYMKNDFFDILMLSISLAVAAIPEGMSSIITIILSLGMSDMAKRNVIIRKMASVETLGSTDIICSDKTGTITTNKMTVRAIYVNDKLYDAKDDIKRADKLFECASFCHTVSKNKDNYIGDETEVAIIKYLDDKKIKFTGEKIKEYSFDSDRKMMSMAIKCDEGSFSFTKGSLDSVINNSKSYLFEGKVRPIDNEFRERIFEIESNLSKMSLRNLAFAYKDKNIDDPEKNMIFIGLIGMIDPPRDTVLGAISTCVNAGIKPIMITGDSINTARAIAKEVNIIDSDDKAIEGKIVDKMSDKELKEAVNKYQVYARISPNTKLRIVEALQNQGYVVAMTGDGVNDAPAIQKADIGIGMGITGTEVVKKVADCILVDDSFATIVDGVEEGRRITKNIKKVILYLLAGNIIEVILVFVSMLLNVEMFTTLQLLWINLVTDSIPAIMLAFEKSDNNIMDNIPDNKCNSSFFTPLLNSKIIIGAIGKSIIMLILYFYFIKSLGAGIASSLMFIYLIANELLFALSCRNIKNSVLNKNIFGNKRLTIGLVGLLILQLVVMGSGLASYFIVDNIPLSSIILTISICIIVFIIEELTKPIFTKLFKDYIKEGK